MQMWNIELTPPSPIPVPPYFMCLFETKPAYMCSQALNCDRMVYSVHNLMHKQNRSLFSNEMKDKLSELPWLGR